MSKFMIGCDPELFVRKRGLPVAAIGLVPGDKEHPHKVQDGAVQVDGLALEINTDPVEMDCTTGLSHRSSFELFNGRIVNVLKQLKAMLPAEYSLDIVPSRVFDKEYYDSLPEDAKVLGCDPDFNAWKDGEMNPRPDGETSLRGAAGHIHIGWGSDIPVDHPDHIDICCHIVKQLDATVGMYLSAIDPDDERRKAYGKAGAFRPKSYGVEWRVPSNVWLRSKALRQQIWNMIGSTLHNCSRGHIYETRYGGTTVEEVINNGMRDIARNLCQYNTGVYPGALVNLKGKQLA